MTKATVLFICIHNSARSQIAEAYLNAFGKDRFQAESAGIEAGKLNPLAVEVMLEDAIDISHNRSKAVSDFIRQGRSFQLVVTVCDEASAASCPVFPGTHNKLNWNFEDPSAFVGTYEEKLIATRIVRDKIKSAVQSLIKNWNSI